MKSNSVSRRLLSLSLLLALWAGVSAAGQSGDPYQLVAETTDQILDTVTGLKAQYGSEVNDEMTQRLLAVLEPVVDFDSIAIAVMGEHRNAASAEQISRFTSEFKQTVVRLYLETFLTFEVQSVATPSAPQDFDLASNRATVQVLATGSNGTVYTLSNSMRTNAQGVWKVRNIVVDGINLGLTYLNQFEGAMGRYNGDIDKVISSWRTDMQ